MQQVGLKQDGAQAWASPSIAWKTIAGVVPATVVVAVCAQISVPLGFTPVPITMQTFAVILLGLLFPPGAAFACLALYLMEGAVGLPVFSPHGPGGLAQLLGPTGGYLLSYPFAAALTGFLYNRGGRRFWAGLASAAVSSVVILGCGFLWIALATHQQPSMVFAQSVVPFLPGDVLKVLAAATCAGALGCFHRNSRNRTL